MEIIKWLINWIVCIIYLNWSKTENGRDIFAKSNNTASNVYST